MTSFENLKLKKTLLVENLCLGLLALIFISKISLKYLGVPRSFSYVLFQHGLHPFINFGLNFLLFGAIFFYWFRAKREDNFVHQYIFILILAIAVLLIQTLFQITYVHPFNSWTLQVGGAVIATTLILLYGIIIPDLISAEKFVSWVRTLAVGFVLISLMLLPLFNLHLFRGGRFIGVFKHIPHMVSASTFAYIFYFPEIFKKNGSLLKKYIVLFLLFFAVFLTATKAAMITILIVTGVGPLVYGEKKKRTRILKFIFVVLAGLFFLLFGANLLGFLLEVATGQSTFLMRPAQDGVASRIEEFYRGFEIFMRSPHFGQGILYKFMSGSDLGVSGYNSFKDPHNIFVSAGVIGGWPFMGVVIIAFVMMIIGSVRGLFSEDPNIKIIGLFLLSHIPVFVIYHVHLSLGGMGDRMYWLVFGYLALKSRKKIQTPLRTDRM